MSFPNEEKRNFIGQCCLVALGVYKTYFRLSMLWCKLCLEINIIRMLLKDLIIFEDLTPMD